MSHRQQITRTPTIAPAFWSFAITGAVQHPLIWSYDELAIQPVVNVRLPIWCPFSGQTADTDPLWSGVALSSLLTDLSPYPDAHYARIHSADGFTTIVPRAALDTALIALYRDGALLSPADGFPARLLFPGRVGYKQAKWVSRIELCAAPDGGTWETRGGTLDGVQSSAVRLIRVTQHGAQFDLRGAALWPSSAHAPDVRLTFDDHYTVTIPITPTQVYPTTGMQRGMWHARWRAPYAGSFALNAVMEGIEAIPLMTRIGGSDR